MGKSDLKTVFSFLIYIINKKIKTTVILFNFKHVKIDLYF